MEQQILEHLNQIREYEKRLLQLVGECKTSDELLQSKTLKDGVESLMEFSNVNGTNC